ncbi:hypothetical protein JCM8097_002254 [Rhodosporidiobolus ruineniae]
MAAAVAIGITASAHIFPDPPPPPPTITVTASPSDGGHTSPPSPPLPAEDPQPATAQAQEQVEIQGEPVEIELLLVSGQRRRWTFDCEETVDEARKKVWEEWPAAWEKTDPRPQSPDYLRLLYLGRFLTPSSTLSSNGLSPAALSASNDDPPTKGQRGPVIVHLHVRTLLPPDDNLKSSSKASKACGCCLIS